MLCDIQSSSNLLGLRVIKTNKIYFSGCTLLEFPVEVQVCDWDRQLNVVEIQITYLKLIVGNRNVKLKSE